jgi:phosphoribosyl 1,2-cyclic phosphodiesterase
MKLEFWGVRGISPTPEAGKLRYGGNTSCIILTSEDVPGKLFVLDAGTGFASFGSTLDPTRKHSAIILLTHMHLQHIIGFQFTPFAFSKEYDTLVMGPSPRDQDLEAVFDTIMQPSYSPVSGVANLMAEEIGRASCRERV